MHAVRIAVTAAVLVMLGAGTLHAQRTLDTAITVRSGARLSVNNYTGNVTVRSWSRSQIRVAAEYERGQVEVRESAGGVSVRSTGRMGGHSDVDYTITVPRGTAIEVSGMSADVEILGVCGEISITMTAGDLNADCAEGSVQMQTISGEITLTNVRGQVDVNSTSGDVSLHGIRGPIRAQSVSGDVSIEQVESDDITAETVSGDVDYSGPVPNAARYRFMAHSGDVTVNVIGTLNATVGIETFNGELESDYQIQIQPGGSISSKNMQFRVGTGSARMQLNSFGGTISLRRGGADHREE